MYKILSSKISQNDSDELNNLIKSEIKNTNHEKEASYNETTIQHDNQYIPSKIKDSNTINIIGIIAIVFGLTLFTTIIYKARRKK